MNLTSIRTGGILAAGILGSVLERWEGAASILREPALALAHATATFLRWLGQPSYLDGTTVYALGFSVRIVPECTGTATALLLGVGILTSPFPRGSKGMAVLLTLAGIFLLNTLRISTVLLVGTRNPVAAMLLHDVGFPILFTLLIGLLWFQWLSREAAFEVSDTHD